MSNRQTDRMRSVRRPQIRKGPQNIVFRKLCVLADTIAEVLPDANFSWVRPRALGLEVPAYCFLDDDFSDLRLAAHVVGSLHADGGREAIRPLRKLIAQDAAEITRSIIDELLEIHDMETSENLFVSSCSRIKDSYGLNYDVLAYLLKANKPLKFDVTLFVFDRSILGPEKHLKCTLEFRPIKPDGSVGSISDADICNVSISFVKSDTSLVEVEGTPIAPSGMDVRTKGIYRTSTRTTVLGNYQRVLTVQEGACTIAIRKNTVLTIGVSRGEFSPSLDLSQLCPDLGTSKSFSRKQFLLIFYETGLVLADAGANKFPLEMSRN